MGLVVFGDISGTITFLETSQALLASFPQRLPRQISTKPSYPTMPSIKHADQRGEPSTVSRCRGCHVP